MTLDQILVDLSKPNMRDFMNASQEAVVVTDADGQIKYHNQRFNDITGKENTLGALLFEDPFEFSDQKLQVLKAAINTGKSRFLTYVGYDVSNGHGKYLNIKITPLKNRDGARVGMIDVTNETLDGLTGAFSQSYLVRTLKSREIANAKRSHSYLGLIGIDLKGLKKVNDTYSDEKGNEQLKKTTELLKRSVRESDYVVRKGGDEFLVVCPYTDPEGIKAIQGRIGQCIDEYNSCVDNPNLKIKLYMFGASDNKEYRKIFENVSVSISQQKTLSKKH